MKADLSDKEEESAFRRKNQEDPNPNREGKAKMVATEEKDACYSKVKSRYKVWPSAYASGALVKCRKVGAKNWGNKTQKEEYIPEFASKETIQRIKSGEKPTSTFGTGGMSKPNNGGLTGGWGRLRKDKNKKMPEGYEFSNWRDEFKPTEYETVDIIETTPLKETEEIRYCPKCKKNEKKRECKYGESYWKMFSLPASLGGGGAYDPNEVHPANEGVSFEIGSGHKKAQKQAKIRNLATGTNNPNEKSAALRKLSGPSLPLADSVIRPGQLTNEDYQRIQSTGNVYTILFSWRGRPMMSLQLFFSNMKRPSKDEVKKEIEKFYPGAVIMQWYPSPTDPSKPIVVIQGK